MIEPVSVPIYLDLELSQEDYDLSVEELDEFSVQLGTLININEIYGGLPSGGAQGQYLQKASSSDYDAIWSDIGDFLPTVTSSDWGKVLAVSSSGVWEPNQQIFKVTISFENNIYTADKTLLEINQAFNRGQPIIAYYIGNIYSYCGLMDRGTSHRVFARITYNPYENNSKIIDMFLIGNTIIREKYTVGSYSLPSGGIPSSDLEASVQSSLNLANTALQSAPIYGADEIEWTGGTLGPIGNPANVETVIKGIYNITPITLLLDDQNEVFYGETHITGSEIYDLAQEYTILLWRPEYQTIYNYIGYNYSSNKTFFSAIVYWGIPAQPYYTIVEIPHDSYIADNGLEAAMALASDLSTKVNIAQGSAYSGKILAVNNSGNVEPTAISAVDIGAATASQGLPSGGTGGQLLMKNSTVDYDVAWISPASSAEADNTRPITAAAVYTEIGNINALLATI